MRTKEVTPVTLPRARLEGFDKIFSPKLVSLVSLMPLIWKFKSDDTIKYCPFTCPLMSHTGNCSTILGGGKSLDEDRKPFKTSPSVVSQSRQHFAEAGEVLLKLESWYIGKMYRLLTTFGAQDAYQVLTFLAVSSSPVRTGACL